MPLANGRTLASKRVSKPQAERALSLTYIAGGGHGFCELG